MSEQEPNDPNLDSHDCGLCKNTERAAKASMSDIKLDVNVEKLDEMIDGFQKEEIALLRESVTEQKRLRLYELQESTKRMQCLREENERAEKRNEQLVKAMEVASKTLQSLSGRPFDGPRNAKIAQVADDLLKALSLPVPK